MNKSETFVESICSILQKNKVITDAEAASMKKLFKDRAQSTFDDFLLEEGLVPKEDLLKALSEHYEVPAFDVAGHFFDHLLVRQIPKEVLRRNVMIPLDTDDQPILIMVANEPDNDELLEVIGHYVSYDVQFMVGLNQDILDAINEYYDESLTMEPTDIDLNEEHRQAREAEEEIDELSEEENIIQEPEEEE